MGTDAWKKPYKYIAQNIASFKATVFATIYTFYIKYQSFFNLIFLYIKYKLLDQKKTVRVFSVNVCASMECAPEVLT